MLIDTHAHLNFATYDKDREKVINRSLKENILILNVGTNYPTSKKAVEIAKDKEGIFASVGLHPINLYTGLIKMRRDKEEPEEYFSFEEKFDYQEYGDLILKGQQKVVAVGEIGFDYWYRPKSKAKREKFKEKQKELFQKEVKLAEEFELPLILHCRLAYDDLVNKLLKIKYKFGGVIHCFCGNINFLKKFLEMGYYIGFNGIIFKKIEGINFNEIIKKTPLEKILIETDCPYLTPPLLNKKRNEPLNVKYIAEKIAQIKKIKIKEVEKVTTENAMTLFKIDNIF